MARYQRIFVVRDVAQVHQSFDRIFRLLNRLAPTPGVMAQRAAARRAYQDFSRELDELAARSAREATAAIRLRLLQTQRRPDTGVAPHLRDLIRSRPLRVGALATGTVGVADEDWLNRAVNPLTPGYGPYWRAQEFGTGRGEVPSQVGRVLRGYFYGTGASGGGTVPVEAFRGRAGPHPIFIPSAVRRGVRGGKGGLGTISVEIRPRYFIRDGANIALADWKKGVDAVQRHARGRLVALK